MNPATFDNNAEGVSDAEYSAFVAWLSSHAIAALAAAKGSSERQRAALLRYYKTGESANLTPGELIDFLAVSTPSIVEQAGYNDAEIDILMAISDALTTDEIALAEPFTDERNDAP